MGRSAGHVGEGAFAPGDRDDSNRQFTRGARGGLENTRARDGGIRWIIRMRIKSRLSYLQQYIKSRRKWKALTALSRKMKIDPRRARVALRTLRQIIFHRMPRNKKRKMANSNSTPCIVCKKELKNVFNGTDYSEHQTDDALMFTADGHYGTTAFDPMDNTYLQVNICDSCIVSAAKEGLVLHVEPMASRSANIYTVWKPNV